MMKILRGALMCVFFFLSGDPELDNPYAANRHGGRNGSRTGRKKYEGDGLAGRAAAETARGNGKAPIEARAVVPPGCFTGAKGSRQGRLRRRRASGTTPPTGDAPYDEVGWESAATS